MSTKNQTSVAYFRSLQTIFNGAAFTQIFFSIVAIAIHMNKKIDFGTFHPNEFLSYLVPAAIVGGIIASYLTQQHRLKMIQSKDNLIDKMTAYRSSLIIRYALLEGPALFALAAFWVSGNFMFFGFALLNTGLFMFCMPSKRRVINELQLNNDELLAINNPSMVIAEIRSQE
jgi:hypothetical protein